MSVEKILNLIKVCEEEKKSYEENPRESMMRNTQLFYCQCFLGGYINSLKDILKTKNKDLIDFIAGTIKDESKK